MSPVPTRLANHWCQRPGRRPGREPRRLLTGVAPIQVRLGRILYHPEAVTLAVEPQGALDPVLEAVRAATAFASGDSHTDTDPWVPGPQLAVAPGGGGPARRPRGVTEGGG